MDATPAFYDDLAACHAELWRCLERGVDERRSPFHTPTLATIGEDGRPRARTVVLRASNRETGTVGFHCDRRSSKVPEIAASGQASLNGYDAAAKIQVRVEGTARLHTDDASAEAAWTAARAMSRVVYGIEPASGTALDRGDGYTLPDEDETATIGRDNFCVVTIEAERLEFLYLDRRGQRRAVWVRGEGGWTGSWVVP